MSGSIHLAGRLAGSQVGSDWSVEDSLVYDRHGGRRSNCMSVPHSGSRPLENKIHRHRRLSLAAAQ